MTAWLLLALAAAPSPAAPPVKVVLPDQSAPASPAQLRLAPGPRAIPSADARDAKDCGSCHLDIAAQWKTSAHAWASFSNPLYRVAIDALRTDRGTTPSRMCGSCHDLALLTTGALDQADVDPYDARAHAGISCTVCHSAVHATRDGNGSLTLRTDAVFPAAVADATLDKHRARVAADTLRTAELCGACHRSFLDASTGNASAFFGMDDYGAWQRSAWAGVSAERPDHVAARDCRGCHMPREAAVLGDVAAKDGTVPSHRFLGAHTLLAAQRGDAAQVARQQAFLQGAATIDVAAARVGEGPWQLPAELAVPQPGRALEVDLVVFNARTGHRFPGGVLDNQGTTVEATLRTAQGQVLARSEAQQLRAEVVDARGQGLEERQTHQFVAAVWNHTVPSRDARVTRVRFQVPAGLSAEALPLTVQARVLHRSRSPQLVARACADAKTPRGRAFTEGAARVTGTALDACVEPPVTVVHEASQAFTGVAAQDSWARAYRRGLGLSVALQEYLDEAEGALRYALTLAQGEEVGQTHWALGALAGRRGQLAQALAELTAAEQVLGPTAAVLKARGDAYAQVWRWPEAASAWSDALRLAPGDLVLWQSLAMAKASAGDPRAALVAAQAGLALHPRDGDCLRVQALALGALGLPNDVALDTALAWRTPDDGPKAKALCSATVPGCAARRNPVPLFEASVVAFPSVASQPSPASATSP